MFFVSFAAESHTHHLKWSFLGSLCKRDLESVQEEDFKNVLHQVDKKALCSTRVLKSG